MRPLPARPVPTRGIMPKHPRETDGSSSPLFSYHRPFIHSIRGSGVASTGPDHATVRWPSHHFSERSLAPRSTNCREPPVHSAVQRGRTNRQVSLPIMFGICTNRYVFTGHSVQLHSYRPNVVARCRYGGARLLYFVRYNACTLSKNLTPYRQATCIQPQGTKGIARGALQPCFGNTRKSGDFIRSESVPLRAFLLFKGVSQGARLYFSSRSTCRPRCANSVGSAARVVPINLNARHHPSPAERSTSRASSAVVIDEKQNNN
jgi:hypothetical protein